MLSEDLGLPVNLTENDRSLARQKKPQVPSAGGLTVASVVGCLESAPWCCPCYHQPLPLHPTLAPRGGGRARARRWMRRHDGDVMGAVKFRGVTQLNRWRADIGFNSHMVE